MKLYHGTSTRYLDLLLRGGIKPKQDQDGEEERGNWEHTNFPSRDDMVYLTVAYPFYFAMCAAGETSDREGEKYQPVVLEVESDELDQDLFHPDEDFIAQVMAEQEKMSLEDCHNYVLENLENWQHLWRESVEHMGNCAYMGTVPPNAIKRYCVFRSDQRPYLSMAFLDPSISILNYRFCGEKHRGYVAWMFQDAELIPTAINPFGIGGVQVPEGLSEELKKQMDYWTAESRNRDGIELVTKKL